MRLNVNSVGRLNYYVSVYLNGEKEGEAIEAYVPGNALEGRGYVVRAIRKDDKAVTTLNMTEPLLPGQYDYEGLLCEKVFGQIRIEIEDSQSLFGEDN